MESAESIRRSLPRDAWVNSNDNFFDFRLRTPYTSGLSPAPWVFIKIMTHIKMLVHVMGINLCQYLDVWLIYSPSHDQCLRDSVQVLNLCHTMGLLFYDKKSEVIPTQKFFFMGYQFDLVSFQVTPTLYQYHKFNALIPAKPKRMCVYVAYSARSLCIHSKTGSSGTAAHPRIPTLHLSTLGFQCFNL